MIDSALPGELSSAAIVSFLPMININPHIIAFQDRIDSSIRLVDETHPRIPSPATGAASPIPREAKGLVFVLLYGAYENLMYSLTRSLLEEALKMRVGNRRLRPGFRAFALASSARSIKDLSDKRLSSHGLPKLVQAADPGGRVCTIGPTAFPVDGSFMKSSQI